MLPSSPALRETIEAALRHHSLTSGDSLALKVAADCLHACLPPHNPHPSSTITRVQKSLFVLSVATMSSVDYTFAPDPTLRAERFTRTKVVHDLFRSNPPDKVMVRAS